MAAPVFDRETILKATQTWPFEEQMELAQAILERVTAQDANAPRKPRPIQQPQRPSWREMAGLAANGQEPPSDEQVAQWLDEHRMEKYGR